jgi:hypothetical protein
MAQIGQLKNVDIQIEGVPIENYLRVIVEALNAIVDRLEALEAAAADDGR